MVELPVWANRTGTVAPTERCLDFAVVESMSRSPAASAAAVPESMRRITVAGRSIGDTAVSVGQRVPELELAAVDGGDRGDPGHPGGDGRHRVAEPPGPVPELVTM